MGCAQHTPGLLRCWNEARTSRLSGFQGTDGWILRKTSRVGAAVEMDTPRRRQTTSLAAPPVRPTRLGLQDLSVSGCGSGNGHSQGPPCLTWLPQEESCFRLARLCVGLHASGGHHRPASPTAGH